MQVLHLNHRLRLNTYFTVFGYFYAFMINNLVRRAAWSKQTATSLGYTYRKVPPPRRANLTGNDCTYLLLSSLSRRNASRINTTVEIGFEATE